MANDDEKEKEKIIEIERELDKLRVVPIPALEDADGGAPNDGPSPADDYSPAPPDYEPADCAN